MIFKKSAIIIAGMQEITCKTQKLNLYLIKHKAIHAILPVVPERSLIKHPMV